GTVIVQDPGSASYPALPSLIPPNVLDFVSRPEQMGELVATLLRRTEVSGQADQQSMLRTVLVEIRDRTGIDVLQYKMPTIVRRLSRLMVASGCETLHEYLRYLQQHPDVSQKLASAFLIKVTEFFRDAQLFEELRATILPRLIEDAKNSNGELRIWSAGTSTGEEAYSVAMLCADLIPDEQIRVRIFATDVNEDAVGFARRGIYDREALRDVPPALVQRYFVHHGDSFEVGKRIRNITIFGRHDLAQRAPFPRIDLVLCRNVLIYFTKELQTRALQLFAFALRDKGYLVLGRSETTMPLAKFFTQADGPQKIFQRIGERVLIPSPRFKDVPQADMRPALATPALPRALVPRPVEIRSSGADIIGKFVFSSAMGLVVVDRHYDIVTLNPAARAMLQIHGVGVGSDLVHSAQGIDRELIRAQIDAALRGEAPGSVNLKVSNELNETRTLSVQCLYDASVSNRLEGVAIILLDVTEEARRNSQIERASVDQTQEIEDFSKRVAELSNRQKALLKANDDLTMANAELRTMNEQYLINVEEAASAQEEAETLNEELEATNEELQTLNEEMHATVEELNTTSDELQSRIGDLERGNSTGEAQVSAITANATHSRAPSSLRGELVAIFNEQSEPLYFSPGLAGDPLASQDGGALRKSRRGKLRDGRSVAIHVQPIQLDGRALEVVTFVPQE
ncbi:MAG: CheR family methyltransferase, partial [Vulcanimicrobiaceae bacterium]